MKLNTKVRYGLRTMIELAMNAGENGLLQKEIALRQEIPLKYLDKIVAELKSAGLIVNVTGKKSGYILSRNASAISVNDIYRAFEGKLAIIPCLNENPGCDGDVLYAGQEFWDNMNRNMEIMMRGTSLEKLAMRQKEFDLKYAEALNFQI